MDNPAPALGFGVLFFISGLAALLAGPTFAKNGDELHVIMLSGGVALVVAAVLLGLGTYLFADNHHLGDDSDQASRADR